MQLVFPLLILTFIVLILTLGLNNDLSCKLIGIREDVVVELV